MIATLPLELRQSITWERGSEMAPCDQVALQLNTRPGKTMDWQTPGRALNQRLVATAV